MTTDCQRDVYPWAGRLAERVRLDATRLALVWGLALMPVGGAWAEEVAPEPAGAIGVSVDCRRTGRVPLCPNFLRTAITEAPVLKFVHRAEADVAIDVDVIQIGAKDRVLLTLRPSATTGGDARREPLVVQFDLDSRSRVDEHLALVRAGMYRAIVPYVLERRPESVQVSFVDDPAGSTTESGSPWGFFGWLGTHLTWSGEHREGAFWFGAGLQHISARRLTHVHLGGNRTFERRPALEVDGQHVSLDRDAYLLDTASVQSFDLDESWSVMALFRTGHEDALGRYALTTRLHVGIGFDVFPSDDPLGNVGQIGYVLGHQYDNYHVPNEIGQESVHFATHGILAAVAFARDTYSLSLSGSLMSEVMHPERRLVLNVTPKATLRLGDHVDLIVEGKVGRQRVPGRSTDPSTSAAALERAVEDEPLSLSGMLIINFNWHPSNGVRYTRWSSRSSLDPKSSL